ncbi:MAG: hypothetical protein FWD69_13700 [Polyangiaceae bacterium]|nr:hypothetical protein [Polyangiaceae bacterium]
MNHLRASSTAVASESRLGRSARSPRKRTFRTCAGTAAPNRRIDFAQQAGELALTRIAALFGVLIFAADAKASDAGAPPPPTPACIQVRAEARWVPYGYNHIVTLANQCSRDAACTVSTNVNPQPQTADVPAGQSVSVLTFNASPSQAFTPYVQCTLK